MRKIILLTLIGLAFSSSGFYVGYLAILETDETKSFLLLIPSGVLIITGTILLFRAGKSDDMIVEKTSKNKDQPLTPIAKTTSLSTLRRNNEMITQWRRTAQQRDRLRMLELANPEEHNN